METKVIYIENTNAHARRLVNKDDIMDEKGSIPSVAMEEIMSSEEETASAFEPDKRIEGVKKMEITPKEYIDDRMSSFEKSMDDKFSAQEKLFSEKIDHLTTKIEKTIGEKFVDFEKENRKIRKEDRRFYVTVAISIAAVAVGLLGYIL